MRSAWNDYNSEFQRLEASIKRAVDRIETGPLAEHIKDSKTFMSEQRQRNDVRDSKSEDQSEINRVFAPLLPSNESMYYYTRDHDIARNTRHPNTCERILRHPKFLKWSRVPKGKGGQLWISAGPGFRKTVLISFIIDHFLDSGNRYERRYCYTFISGNLVCTTTTPLLRFAPLRISFIGSKKAAAIGSK